jgi:hypothetical protein
MGFFDKLLPRSKKLEKRDRAPLLTLGGASAETCTNAVGRTIRYAFIDVINQGDAAGTGCWATATTPGKNKFPIHWAAVDCNNAEAKQKIDIPPGKHVRLEIAFSLPPSPGVEKLADISGCWIAQPEALRHPTRDLKAFLPPGEYRININVGCNQEVEVSTTVVKIISTETWENLAISFI